VGCARLERKGTAAAECSSVIGNWTREVAEQHVGVDVVLLRARGRKLRHCSELSTTARRWRPGTARERRGVRGRSHQGRGKGSGSKGNDAWMSSAVGGGARGTALAANGGGRSSTEREAAVVRGGRSREMSGGLVCEFQKFQGPLYKLRFPVDRKV
jgi:hypothetical protein